MEEETVNTTDSRGATTDSHLMKTIGIRVKKVLTIGSPPLEMEDITEIVSTTDSLAVTLIETVATISPPPLAMGEEVHKMMRGIALITGEEASSRVKETGLGTEQIMEL